MIQFNRYPGGKQHCVTLSYDDGREFDERLVGIFNQYGMKSAFHLNSGKLGMKGYMKAERVAEIYAGQELSCHTVDHPDLEGLPLPEIVQQTMRDRVALEGYAGYPVRGMSYPFGTYNEEVIQALRSCGIVYSRTVKSTGGFSVPRDFMRWHPTCHHRECLSCAERFLERAEMPWTSQLFYVWGHSYEFDQERNWDLIEEFCQKVGGRPDVWYATNIEIFDYISALRRLQISADGRIVKNPSAAALWFTAGDQTVKIEPGETLCL